MSKKAIAITSLVLLSGGGYWWFSNSKSAGAAEPTYRTAKVERGAVVRSITATGTIKSHLIVDVKSRAGGPIVELNVDVGSVVSKGDLLARIDPSDTMTSLNQAKADLSSSVARIEQAKQNLELQKLQNDASIRQSKASLEAAKARLTQAQKRADAQPAITHAQVESARSALETAKKNLEQLLKVTIPQTRAQARANFDSAKTQRDVAERNLDRQKGLLEKGYVSKQAVDNATSQLESARSAFITAEERLRTLEDDLSVQTTNAQTRVKEAEANLKSAEANQIQVDITRQALEESKAQVAQAEAALRQAEANRIQIQVREGDITTAQAQKARSDAQVSNAQVQYDSATIYAPNNGVVITKNVEVGTIIPAGTSLVSQGTTLLQIADTDRLFIEVSVDEADIASVEEDQDVDITIDAYPDEIFEGKVTRIDPQAVLEQNVTIVRARVEVLNPDARLKPGMNATCEFILKRQTDTLNVPSEAVKDSEEGKYVEILVNGKPERAPVEVGIVGNERTEILSGLEEGEEVITAIEMPSQETGGPPAQSRGSPMGSPFPGGGRR